MNKTVLSLIGMMNTMLLFGMEQERTYEDRVSIINPRDSSHQEFNSFVQSVIPLRKASSQEKKEPQVTACRKNIPHSIIFCTGSLFSIFAATFGYGCYRLGKHVTTTMKQQKEIASTRVSANLIPLLARIKHEK